MLVARSFNYGPSQRAASSASADSHSTSTEKSTRPVRGFGWRPSSFKASPEHTASSMTHANAPEEPVRNSNELQKSGRTCQDGGASAVAGNITPSHSQPVAVPSRGQKHSSFPGQRARMASQKHGKSPSSSNNLSSSAAAMLASTSIPKRRTFSKSQPPAPASTSSKNLSIDKLVEEWNNPETTEASSLSSSPAMELLLSPPEQAPDMNFLDEDDTEVSDPLAMSGSMPSRSISSTSITSLDVNDSSSASASTPTTPFSYLSQRKSSRPESSTGRRQRSISISKSIDSAQDHPLRTSSSANDDDRNDTEDERISLHTSISSSSNSRASSPPPRSKRPQYVRKTSTTKSNLTSSLQSLRSTITRSFANFAATPTVFIPPQDELARGFGLIGAPPSYNPEMRPRPLEGLPSPEMRRYLNPHAFHLYGNRLDVPDAATLNSNSNTAQSDALRAEEEALIPLQPYKRRPPPPRPSPSHALSHDLKVPQNADEIPTPPLTTTSPPPTNTAPTAAQSPNPAANLSYNHTQRREPRENPEFLRIALLEMSMRRAGKLESAPFGAGSGGRRSWWLPAREVVVGVGEEVAARGMVPRRWVGVCV